MFNGIEENYHQRRNDTNAGMVRVGLVIREIVKDLVDRHGFEVDNKNVTDDEDEKQEHHKILRLLYKPGPSGVLQNTGQSEPR